ncbi:MAG: hypothetical protein H3C51_11780 [Rubellimicrobium sp.]|nr:hypothetical protein [Rubellimicrobium sp.]
MAKVGDVNVFRLRVVKVRDRQLDLVCEECGTEGSAPVEEFQSTRCGSARCGSSQGRAE